MALEEWLATWLTRARSHTSRQKRIASATQSVSTLRQQRWSRQRKRASLWNRRIALIQTWIVQRRTQAMQVWASWAQTTRLDRLQLMLPCQSCKRTSWAASRLLRSTWTMTWARETWPHWGSLLEEPPLAYRCLRRTIHRHTGRLLSRSVLAHCLRTRLWLWACKTVRSWLSIRHRACRLIKPT